MVFSSNITYTKFAPFENIQYFNLVFFQIGQLLLKTLSFKKLNYFPDIFDVFHRNKILVLATKSALIYVYRV